MSLAILFHSLCAQHVSDINISIIRSLRLCRWITTSVVLFSVRCVLEIWGGWVWVVPVQASACNTGTTQILLLQMVLQPGVGLGLRYNMPPGLSVPHSLSLHSFIPIFLRSMDTSSSHLILGLPSSSCCIQLSVQHLLCDCGVLHSFYMPKPSYSLAFNKPDNVLSLDYGFELPLKPNHSKSPTHNELRTRRPMW